jgi:hypothetical protein
MASRDHHSRFLGGPDFPREIEGEESDARSLGGVILTSNTAIKIVAWGVSPSPTAKDWSVPHTPARQFRTGEALGYHLRAKCSPAANRSSMRRWPLLQAISHSAVGGNGDLVSPTSTTSLAIAVLSARGPPGRAAHRPKKTASPPLMRPPPGTGHRLPPASSGIRLGRCRRSDALQLFSPTLKLTE